ncbi:MAG TPA: phospholipase D-like domain-containing protein [Pyrinomonadaceae bacterium]|nr:phospholipase D-like domain-containing protein [Pyrinomonadaceae bacterium]
MITVTGRVVDDQGTPMTDVQVVALGDWLLTSEKLAKPLKVNNDGRFTLKVDNIEPGETGEPGTIISSFRVRVVDLIGRQLSDDQVVPGTADTHDLKDITVHRADKDGLAVTHLTGTAKFVSEGNAIKLLVDGLEAFGRIADEIKRAEHSINITQLFFGLPEEFAKENEAIDPGTNEPKEKANLVFKFSPTELKPRDPDEKIATNAPRIGDDRPERLLLDKIIKDKTLVRVLLNEPGLGFPEGIFWLAVLTPLAAGLGIGGVVGVGALLGIGLPFFPLVLATTVVLFFVEYVKIKLTLQDTTDVDKSKKYFGSGTAAEDVQRIIIHGFRQAAPDNGVQHCKMLIFDQNRAVVVGSPFSQRYFDSNAHQIDDPRRGGNTSDMVHDLSMAVVGPAARDLFETFRTYWNEDISQVEKVPALPDGLTPNTQTSGEDAICKVQVVRTRSGKRFADLNGKSEKGILEGYLRAFAAAQHYIYLENQYFTDSVITDALVEALKAKPDLELIMVVPIKPDVIFYPTRQAKRIGQIREAGGDRVGVFTRWSYKGNLPNDGRPWVAPVYIHAKGGVVDDSWCTVGSANLDGLSLDYNLLLSPLVFGETTACELNVNVLPTAPGAINPFAQMMRRRLFAEHLGIVDASKQPNPNDDSLKPGPEHKWLRDLWRPTAASALEKVKNAVHGDFPGFVLEYPKEDGGWLDTPRKHLAALGVELTPSKAVIRPITGTRKFHFSTGKWDAMPEREDVDQ